MLFYDIDTPITMARLRENGGMEYLEAEMIPHYAAYLTFAGGPALRVLEETVRFAVGCAVLLFGRPGDISADKVPGGVPVRPKLSRNLCKGSAEKADAVAGWRRGVVAAAKIPGGGTTVSRGNWLGIEHRSNDPCFTHGTSRILLFIAFHAKPNARRHGVMRLFAFGALIRGIGVRRSDRLR